MSEELKNQKISITEKAASRLKNIIENEETDTKGIRVTILSLIHISEPTRRS